MLHAPFKHSFSLLTYPKRSVSCLLGTLLGKGGSFKGNAGLITTVIGQATHSLALYSCPVYVVGPKKHGKWAPVCGISGLSLYSLSYFVFGCCFLPGTCCWSFCLLIFVVVSVFCFLKIFFIFFFHLEWVNQMEWSMILACPNVVVCFLTRAVSRELTLWKGVWCLCMQVLFYIYLCMDCFCRFDMRKGST